MAAQHRIRGGPAAALPSFSLLSLNVARQATLGGLAVLLDQLPQLPTVIFLQEVAMAADLLQAAAQRLGFESHVSPSPQDFSRRLVLLYRAAEVPAITDFTPGFFPACHLLLSLFPSCPRPLRCPQLSGQG